MARSRRRLTPSEYAEHRGVTRQAVHKAIGEGRIPVQNGLIDRDVADEQWKANSIREASGDSPGAGEAESGGTLTYARARALREGIRARLLQMELEERMGRTHDSAECDHRAEECSRLTETSILALVPKISGSLHAAPSKRELELLLMGALKEEFKRVATSILERVQAAREGQAG